jgi:hypothetical protein
VPVELTRGDLRDIDQAVPKIPLDAPRYPETLEAMTGR